MGIERRDRTKSNRNVLGRDGVDGNVQRLPPARAAVAILPGAQRDDQQHEQQDENAQHLESAAGRGFRLRLQSEASTLNSTTSPLLVLYDTASGLQHTGQSSI